MGALDGWGVLVTGGGSGIGKAAAQRLAAEGAVVTICGRSKERVEGAATEIADAVPGAEIIPVVADVTDEQAVEAAVAQADEAPHGLKGVVASAGGSSSTGPVTMLDTQKWRDTVELNLTGTMLTLKHSARRLVANGGGAFAAVSSFAGSSTHRWFGAYGPAKAGLEMLCKQAADELGASKVRVNIVAPGLIRTDLVEMITAGGPVLDDYLANTPLGRVGEAEEVAELLRFLVGPESAWITGQRINIDGGQGLRRGPDFSSLYGQFLGEDALRGVV